MTPAEERAYHMGILRDAQTIFTAFYLSPNQTASTELAVAHRLILDSDDERRGALAVALARFGANFARFVDQCAAAAELTGTRLEHDFSTELLSIFCRQQERDIDHYERTGEFR